MRSVWCIVIAASTALGLAGPGVAQTPVQKPPLYTTTPATPPDPNYGLPAFALPGYEAPRPKAVTPEANGTADQANGSAVDRDFYQRAPESRYTLPRQTGETRYSTMETPLYTTEEGMPAGDRARTDTMEPETGESDTLGDYLKTKR